MKEKINLKEDRNFFVKFFKLLNLKKIIDNPFFFINFIFKQILIRYIFLKFKFLFKLFCYVYKNQVSVCIYNLLFFLKFFKIDKKIKSILIES